MTTDTELRDLLSAAADGPAAPDWDGVLRRGRHHRRRNRIRAAVAACGVVGLGVLGVTSALGLIDDDRQGVVADAPDGTTTPPAPSTTLPPFGPLDPAIRTNARVSGAFVTVLVDPADPTTGFDPCVSRRPKVTETETAVVVETVDATNVIAERWAACQSSAFSGWATVELTDPLGSRPLFGSTSNGAPEIPVIDNANLLFPTVLPEPFDITHWDEFSQATYEGAPVGNWTFAWTAGDLVLNIGRWDPDGEHPEGCADGEQVEVRGSAGHLCTAASSALLSWSDGRSFRTIELVDVSDQALLPDLDVLAIADGLEPLG